MGWLPMGCIQDLTHRTDVMALPWNSGSRGKVSLGRSTSPAVVVLCQGPSAFYKQVSKLVAASYTERTGSSW